VRSIAADTELVEIDDGPFTAESFLAAAERLTEPARFISLVPAQLQRLLDSSTATTALARFDRVLLGGQATPATLLHRALERGVRITRTYGSSETSGGCVYDGEAIGTTRVRVTDGEVELSGPVLAEGYLDDPARTEAAFVVDEGTRWYRTGDTGALAGGVLTVTGRLDDVIISGGVKVSLGEVETVVRSIAGLESAVVVRGSSVEWGEVPVVVATVDAELAAVREAVAARLGRAAAPSRIHVIAELPLLASGKPDRAWLAASIAR